MFVPWEALNGRHPAMEICSKGAERKLWRQVEEGAHASAAAAFQAYGQSLAIVLLFKYLGRVLTASDED